MVSRDPSLSEQQPTTHYFANHPIGQNHYSGRGNENIQTTRSPLRMPAVNRRRLPRNRRRGRFFVASITLYRRAQLVAAVPRCARRLGCAKHRRLPHRGTIRILIKKDRIAAPVTGQLISGQNVAWPGEYAEKGNLGRLSIHGLINYQTSSRISRSREETGWNLSPFPTVSVGSRIRVRSVFPSANFHRRP